MQNQFTLRQQIESFYNDGTFPGDYAHCYGFYDWFCKDEALKAKAEDLMPKVLKFAKKMNIDLDKHYVFFKNNCPMSGPLYDDFRICDLQTGEVVYNVTPKSGHTGLAEVHGIENNFLEPLFQGPTWSEMYHLLVPSNWKMPVATI